MQGIFSSFSALSLFLAQNSVLSQTVSFASEKNLESYAENEPPNESGATDSLLLTALAKQNRSKEKAKPLRIWSSLFGKEDTGSSSASRFPEFPIFCGKMLLPNGTNRKSVRPPAVGNLTLTIRLESDRKKGFREVLRKRFSAEDLSPEDFQKKIQRRFR